MKKNLLVPSIAVAFLILIKASSPCFDQSDIDTVRYPQRNTSEIRPAGWTSQSPTNDVTIETQHLLKGLTLDHYLAEGHFVSSNSTSKRIRSSLFQLKKKQSISFSIEQINAVEQGLCTYGEISAKSQICETMFFKLIITQPAANCRKLFTAMQRCNQIIWDSCFPNNTLDSNINPTSTQLVSSESSYCADGGLVLPISNQSVEYCSQDYISTAVNCIQSYSNRFTRNSGDRNLCGDYMEARECLYHIQDVKCNYPPLIKTLKNAKRKLYRCWNPFCVWRSSPVRTPNLSSPKWKKGLPTDCLYNTASGIISNLSMESSTLVPSASIKTKRPNLKVMLRQAMRKVQERKNNNQEPFNGRASKLYLSLDGFNLFFCTIIAFAHYFI